MVTQITMSPPQPVSDSSKGIAPAKSQNNPDSTAAASNISTSPAPTDFKQALHAARGKHKPANATTTATPAPAKKTAAPVATKAKVIPQTQPDEDQEQDSTENAEEATAETIAKTAANSTTPQAVKQSTKKTFADAEEEEQSESSAKENVAKPQPQATVHAVTPDGRQSSGSKERKPGQKSKAKTDSDAQATVTTNTPVNPSLALISQPASPQTAADQTPDADSAQASKGVQPNSTATNKSGIHPHHDETQNASDPSSNAATTAAADPADSANTADPSDDSSAVADDVTANMPSPSASTPHPATATAISNSLAALGSITQNQPAETTTAPSASVSPTRAFAQANQDQIVTTIKGQLLPDGGSMQITLHPANLGHVHISVQVTAGSVSATFETTNEQATRLLSHNLSQLKQTLEAAGVVVEKLQVTQSRDPQSQTQSDSKQSSQQQSATDQRGSQQEQQRREILQQMWDKVAGAQDWIDVKA